MFQCNFKFKSLTVLDAQEESWYSNGDEPYFVFFGLRSRFKIPGSTNVFWGGYLNDDWAKGVRDNSTRTIPSQMGVVTFPNVTLISKAQFQSGIIPEVVGIVGVAMESDATAFSTIRTLMGKVQNAIYAEMKRLIEDGNINLLNPGPDIDQAITNVRNSLTFTTRDKIKLFFGSWADPDDLIGTQAQVFIAGDQSLKTFLPNLNYLEAKNLQMNFTGDGASYRVTGILEMVAQLAAAPA